MIGIDLFAGAGGMSLGAEMAGINVKCAVEKDFYSAQTFFANHKNCPHIFNIDIKKFELPKINKRDEQLVVFGGPPCQGFSTSNQRTRSSENPNNWLFLEFLRVVKDSKPEWIVFENVKGITEISNGAFVEMISKELEQLGYTISINILNAKDFGIPQKRSRFFLIGSIDKINIEVQSVGKEIITVKSAFEDLPIIGNGASISILPYYTNASHPYAKLMRGNLDFCDNHLVSRNSPIIVERYNHIPQGGNWEHIPDELMVNYKDKSRCHTGIYRRLKENEPSVVIGNYRKNMLIHPTFNRGLSVREAARLQSFPDWFTFKGSIGFQQQQVGNAVPPYLAKEVFEAILKKR